MKIAVIVDNDGWCWTTTARAVAAICPEHDFRIVKAKDYKPGDCDIVWMRGYAHLVRTAPKAPMVWTLSTGGKALPARVSRNENCIYKNVICQCNSGAEALRELGFRCWVIPNGVDTMIFSPPAGDGKRKRRKAGLAGNDRDGLKGLDLVREACEGVVQFDDSACGNKGGKPFIAHGKMADWYRSLWAYCQPSESEGCSNAVMEAMATGLPCLVCKGVGYHGEACRDGLDFAEGEVVFVERTVESIRSRLSILMENPYLYARVSANARKFAERHEWRYIARKTISVLAEVLAESPPVMVTEKRTKEVLVMIQAVRPVVVGETTYRSGEIMAVRQDIAERLFSKGMAKRPDLPLDDDDA